MPRIWNALLAYFVFMLALFFCFAIIFDKLS